MGYGEGYTVLAVLPSRVDRTKQLRPGTGWAGLVPSPKMWGARSGDPWADDVPRAVLMALGGW